MRILILGGTIFVGRHLARAALDRGHDVTLFNRGNRPEVLPGLERIVGDRDGGLDGLSTGSWDAVIDTSGYVPRIVRDSVAMLRNRVARYAFVSTISVYADATVPHQDEDAELAKLPDESVETVSGDTYGGLKALCEREVREGYPDAHLILRPGIIVGPYDPTDRFTYWVRRMAGEGEVLAPNVARQPMQWIDGRDLARWTVRALEREVDGTFNLVNEADAHTFESTLTTCREAGGGTARPMWVDEDFLLEREVRSFADLPMWLPGEDANLFRVDAGRARSESLEPRPLADTARDTLAWDRERGTPEMRAGLSPDRERELLADWRST